MAEAIIVPEPGEEEECPVCLGTGKVAGKDCPLCGGERMVPTEVAQRAIDVAARRLRGERPPRRAPYNYKKPE